MREQLVQLGATINSPHYHAPLEKLCAYRHNSLAESPFLDKHLGSVDAVRDRCTRLYVITGRGLWLRNKKSSSAFVGRNTLSVWNYRRRWRKACAICASISITR